MESDSEALPSKKRRHCCHCKHYVGYSTYYRHWEAFFDPISKQWSLDSSDRNESMISNDEFSASELNSSDTEDFSGEIELYSQGFEGLLILWVYTYVAQS